MKHCYVYILLSVTLLASISSAKNIIPTFPTARHIDGRIIGGTAAEPGQFPSAAAIYVSTNDATFFCGGTLISDQFVLTSARCILGGVAFQVLLGSNTLQGADPNRVTVTTSTYITHPDFNADTLENDIGLVKLSDPIQFTDYIKSAYLLTVDVSVGMSNTAIGWGTTSDASDTLSNTLNYVEVTVLPNAQCQQSFSNVIFDSMVCVAGSYNEGSCRGDSGSPLIMSVLELQWVMAVASFISTNGCESADPSGYTRTFPYTEWILTTAGIL